MSDGTLNSVGAAADAVPAVPLEAVIKTGMELIIEVLDFVGDRINEADVKKARDLHLEMLAILLKDREDQSDRRLTELRAQIPVYERSAILAMRARNKEKAS